MENSPVIKYDVEIQEDINIKKIFFVLKKIENLIKKGYNRITIFINSCGGEIDGCHFFFNAIQELKKNSNVYFLCYCNDALSAAYWVASAFDKLVAIDENSAFGNIGVINVLEREENKNLFFISSTEQKAELAGLKNISEDTASALKINNNEIYSTFVKDVLKKRKIKNEHLQGQIFLANDALANGFIDEVLNMDTDKEITDLQTDENMSVDRLRLELQRLKNEFQRQQEEMRKKISDEIKRIEEIYLIGTQLDIDKEEIKNAIENQKLSSGEFAISQIKKMGKTSFSLNSGNNVNVNSIIEKIMNK